MLSKTRKLLGVVDTNPNHAATIRLTLNVVAKDIILMMELLATLADSMNKIELPKSADGDRADSAAVAAKVHQDPSCSLISFSKSLLLIRKYIPPRSSKSLQWPQNWTSSRCVLRI